MLFTFTGGPASGKSSTIRILKSKLRSENADVVFIPEAYTSLFGSYMPDELRSFVSGSEADLFKQYLIGSFQTAAVNALRNGERIIITDRGLYDAGAYLSGKDADQFFSSFSEKDLEMSLPDHLVYFQAPPQYYRDQEDETFREENDFKEMQERGMKTLKAWKSVLDARRIHLIQPSDSIEDKAAKVGFLLNELSGKELFS